MKAMAAAMALAASAAGILPASAEFMTEAERRAQLVRISEGSHDGRATASFAGRSGAAIGQPPGTIVIETAAKVLHFVEGDGSVVSWPIAVGREGAQWKGTTHVTGKRKNPEWRLTPNMRKRDPSLPEVVAPGPSNPLGARAIYLAEGYLRIHGTNAPSSIGTAASSGCFRMHNEHVSDLYERVRAGAKVVVLE